MQMSPNWEKERAKNSPFPYIFRCGNIAQYGCDVVFQFVSYASDHLNVYEPFFVLLYHLFVILWVEIDFDHFIERHESPFGFYIAFTIQNLLEFIQCRLRILLFYKTFTLVIMFLQSGIQLWTTTRIRKFLFTRKRNGRTYTLYKFGSFKTGCEIASVLIQTIEQFVGRCSLCRYTDRIRARTLTVPFLLYITRRANFRLMLVHNSNLSLQLIWLTAASLGNNKHMHMVGTSDYCRCNCHSIDVAPSDSSLILIHF